VLDVSVCSPDLCFGSMVRGLQLEQLKDEEIRRKLRDLWTARGILVFRDCDSSTEFQLRLSEVFGPLVHHQQEELWVAGHPELMALRADDGVDMTIEVEGEIRVGCFPWHADACWLAQPPHGALLRVHRMPKAGGETGFIDMISTYDRLPETLKQRIAGLESVIRFSADPELIYKFQPQKVRMINNGAAAKSLDTRKDFPPIARPLVQIQPETGRKVLGFVPMPLQQIIGLSEEDSEALLYELASYATDERHAYVHSYQHGDMVLWDNLRVLHKAYGVPPGDEREIWRTTIAAAYAVARPLEDGGFTWKKAAA
jgi:taurine dioxygenase